MLTDHTPGVAFDALELVTHTESRTRLAGATPRVGYLHEDGTATSTEGTRASAEPAFALTRDHVAEQARHQPGNVVYKRLSGR